MNRRDFLKQGLTVSAGVALSGLPKFTGLAHADDPTKWRTFEVITTIEVKDPLGGVRTWVPVPLTNNTDYFKREPDSWTGNFKAARAVQYDKYGTGMVFAEWAPSEKTPLLEVKSRFMTRDRAIDVNTKPTGAAKENPAVLNYFRQPSKLIRTDGVVAWRCSIEKTGPQSENIEVIASHLGLGAHPAVLYAVADRLAQPEGEWKPFNRGVLGPLVYPDPDRDA